MVEKFNFNLFIHDYIIVENDFITEYYDYKEKTKNPNGLIPKYSILKIENVSMGGYYKGGLFIVFNHPKKINKHITEKVPSKFKIDAYKLNGLEYTVYDNLDLAEKKINSIKRISKIKNLLATEEA